MGLFVLGKKAITLKDVYEVSMRGRKVALSEGSKKDIQKSFNYLQKEISKGHAIYGVNTGFGVLSNVKINKNQIEELQYNLLRSHATGVGDILEEKFVRAMLFLRAASLSQGNSGVSLKLVESILKLLNNGIHPVVPVQGSVGASGDLAPLAHLGLALIGEGEVFYRGKKTSSKSALKQAGLKLITLGPKEGLALINGTQFMTAISSLSLYEAEYLISCADLISSLTLESLRGSLAAFDSEIQEVRPHPGQIKVAQRLRQFLRPGNKTSAIMKSHKECDRVQDPYSLRCIPQVHGATNDTFHFVKGIVEREINSVTDNPLIFPESNKIISGGNFHGQYVAMAMDFLTIALSELANISEQRIQKLVNPAFSSLPAFLVEGGGLNSGFMIVQVAAASLVSENKTLSHPAVVDSIPTSSDKEDHVSMGAWASRKSNQVLKNTRHVLAMELLCASQAIDFLRPLKSTEPLEALHKKVRSVVPFMKKDRILSRDILKVEKLIRDFAL